MEYLLEMEWMDPRGRYVGEILSMLPLDLVETRGSLSLGVRREFALLRLDKPSAVEDLAAALGAAGVEVQIVLKEA